MNMTIEKLDFQFEEEQLISETDLSTIWIEENINIGYTPDGRYSVNMVYDGILSGDIVHKTVNSIYDALMIAHVMYYNYKSILNAKENGLNNVELDRNRREFFEEIKATFV